MKGPGDKAGPGWLDATVGTLALITGKVFGWNLLRLVFQLAWAILLARVLGVEGYGVFSGVAGLAIGLSGLAGVGLGLRMYQEAASDDSVFERRWAQARRASVWSGCLLGVLFVVAGVVWDVLPAASVSLLVAVAISELLLAPIIALLAFGYAAKGRMSESAMVPAVLSFFRMLAAAVFLLAPPGSGLATYAVLHVLATAAAVGISAMRFIRHVPVRAADPAVGARDMVAGLGYTSIWVSGTALSSIDKAAVLRWGGADAAGTYTASYRFSSLLALPVEALLMTALPRLFRAGAGAPGGNAIIAKLFLYATGYGLLAGVLLWSFAPFLPGILGPEFANSIVAARVMAWYLPVFCLRSLAANVLLAFQQKTWRFTVESAGLILLLLLMASWVPHAGALAAAKALLFAEIAIMLAMWTRVVALLCNPRTTST